jgi:hypothetical protein
MQLPDIINGTFEAFGAWSVWANVKRLRKDRDVKGVVWQFTIVWWLWGVWNLVYYPLLSQFVSTAAGLVLVTGNAVWLITWLKIRREKRVNDPTHG